MEDFVAIDFETANEKRGSACEVSLAHFSNGEWIESKTSLIYQERFNSFNTLLHGISASDVRKAPKFAELWPELRKFIGDKPVVAHNAGFDLSVLYQSLDGADVGEELTYTCTMVMARRCLDIPYFGLPGVAEHLSVEYPMNHRAEFDARAAGEVAVKLAQLRGVTSISELSDSLKVKLGILSNKGPSGSIYVGKTPSQLTQQERDQILSQIPESELYEDPDFVGKKVVFTGALLSMERREAHIAVMKAGGIPKDSVTKDTNMLVYGYQDPRMLKGKPLSSKLQKAVDLRSKGADLELVDEMQFIEMLSSRD